MSTETIFNNNLDKIRFLRNLKGKENFGIFNKKMPVFGQKSLMLKEDFSFTTDHKEALITTQEALEPVLKQLDNKDYVIAKITDYDLESVVKDIMTLNANYMEHLPEEIDFKKA